MKIFKILLLFCSLNVVAQIDQGQIDLDQKIEFSKNLDSILIASENVNPNENKILRGLSEGSIDITEQTTYLDQSSEPEETVGSGGFSRYVYRNKETNEILKVQHNSTVHYKKDISSANSERLEIAIYYSDKIPFLAKIIENHYTDSTVISSNRYYLNLPKNIYDLQNTYYSNDVLKRIVLDIFQLNKEVMKEE